MASVKEGGQLGRQGFSLNQSNITALALAQGLASKPVLHHPPRPWRGSSLQSSGDTLKCPIHGLALGQPHCETPGEGGDVEAAALRIPPVQTAPCCLPTPAEVWLTGTSWARHLGRSKGIMESQKAVTAKRGRQRGFPIAIPQQTPYGVEGAARKTSSLRVVLKKICLIIYYNMTCMKLILKIIAGLNV